MLRKLNYNAARGRKKRIATVGCGGLSRAVGREGKDKTKQGKATSRRQSKAHKV